ncbi:MAG: 50S ribosomal protein L29 [Ignavibacteria bacterium]|nr:50S ribosomal protein L29 [Ignavibacteria bacterium]MBI3765917.1 50S ribosomal protein L29 [Ignavibacteriales bacterium]
MKIFEIRELPDEELRKRIKDEEENLVHLKFQKATSQLESPIKVRLARRDIARMRTVLREREMKQSKIQATAPVAST